MFIMQTEAIQIAKYISPIFVRVSSTYDFTKYPASDYDRFKRVFSSLAEVNNEIGNALLWKWGHWGKANYPQKHRNLVAEVSHLWPVFISSGYGASSQRTYEWWSQKLNRTTTYITVAYITHLVHSSEPLPIIDQHNFRGMNALLHKIRPSYIAKKKPSQWADIIDLKNFMVSISQALGSRSFEEIDRFLMMFGKNHVER
jgi:hypothetical protein